MRRASDTPGLGITADIVRGQFEAVNRGDFAAAMRAYADDVELIVPDTLMAGTYRGKEAVGEFFGDLFRTFGAARFEVVEILEAGDGVALTARFVAEGMHSGVPIASTLFYAFRLRDGKVARVQFCNTRDEALEASGLPASAS